MDTPISISSSDSTKNSEYSKHSFSPRRINVSGLSLDSPGSEREVADWDRRNGLSRSSPSNTTISNIQKVSNWIKSIEGNDSGTESALNDLGKRVF